MPPPLHINQLATAVQNAVEQTLAKHGAVPIDKLWIGFVAPENLANVQNATQVAHILSREAGVAGQASVATLGAAAAGETEAHKRPGFIMGLIFNPNLTKT